MKKEKQHIITADGYHVPVMLDETVDGMNIRFMNPGSATISVESLYQGIRKTFDILVLDNPTNTD